MAAPDYDVLVLDLAVARDAQQVTNQGNKINGVVVLASPGGATAFLHFGAGRQPIPVVQGDSWEIAAERDGCLVALDEGLRITNPVGAGNITLLVSYGNIGAGTRAVA